MAEDKYKHTADEIRKNNGVDLNGERPGGNIELDFANDPKLIELDNFSKKIGEAIQTKDLQTIQTAIDNLELNLDAKDFTAPNNPDAGEKAVIVLFTKKMEQVFDIKGEPLEISLERKIAEHEYLLGDARVALKFFSNEKDLPKEEEENLSAEDEKKLDTLQKNIAKAEGEPPESEVTTAIKGEELECRHTAPIMTVMLDNAGIENELVVGMASIQRNNGYGAHVTSVTKNDNYADPVNGHQYSFGTSQPLFEDLRNEEEKETGRRQDIVTHAPYDGKGEPEKRVFDNMSEDLAYFYYMMENDNKDLGKADYKNFIEDRIEALGQDISLLKAQLKAQELIESEQGKPLNEVKPQDKKNPPKEGETVEPNPVEQNKPEQNTPQPEAPQR